jgi:signal transduction histidine kinase
VHHETEMDIRRRFADVVLATGAVCVIVSTPVLWRYGDPVDDLPWLVAMAVLIAAATYTWRKLRDDRAAWWFALGAGAAGMLQGVDTLLAVALDRDADASVLAWLALAYHVGLVFTGGSMAHLFGLFPDGSPQTGYERASLRGVWVLFVFPPVVLLALPTIQFPSYYAIGTVVNPYAVRGLAGLGEAAAVVTTMSQAAFGAGVVILGLRYRRASAQTRRRIRWLLVPALVTLFAILLDVVVHAPGTVLVLLYISSMLLVPVTIAVALLRPSLLDVDLVLRKSLVYGLLWLAIAAVYVGAAASLGVAAGQHFSVGMAITLTVVATLVFQPARRWLEVLADRWVFGARTDPTRLVARLGAALEETVELERLLPRMAATLEEGLGLRWARVRLQPLSPAAGGETVLQVPIVLGDEHLGVVECGPKFAGPLTADDEAVVTTLARQAALAVRNVRLTAELEHSRVRLVRAQDAERRRIERNIHDGVQQDLVALIANAGYARAEIRRDPVAGEVAVAELQDGLQRVNTDLRELAHGIHPSVLGDRGLLEAVEALATRSSVPVAVWADPALRGERFAQEIEGASYFTVAEALANVSKHAAATCAEVRLARSDDALHIAVHDDGEGFNLATAVGEGLTNLAERLTALGGRLDVDSTPGQGTTVTAQLRVSRA